MLSPLDYSVFKKVLFPPIEENIKEDTNLVLKKIISFHLQEDVSISSLKFSIFDFETTGLKITKDKIIEIGAVKIDLSKDSNSYESFETLINPEVPFNKNNVSANITGITEEMLKDQPLISEVLPKFLDFINGTVLIAHNAEFDFNFLKNTCLDQGYELSAWPCYCTLKMARTLHPELESKSLDSLANLYSLTFDARHRSVGDALVTKDVFIKFIEEAKFNELKDMEHFKVI